MTYEASPVGHERTIVMFGVSLEILNDHPFLEHTLIAGLQLDEFTVLDKVKHMFSPQGFAFVALLAESHAALHTYPEFGSLVFTIYSCRREGDGDTVVKYLIEKFNPTSFTEKESSVVVNK